MQAHTVSAVSAGCVLTAPQQSWRFVKGTGLGATIEPEVNLMSARSSAPEWYPRENMADVCGSGCGGTPSQRSHTACALSHTRRSRWRAARMFACRVRWEPQRGRSRISSARVGGAGRRHTTFANAVELSSTQPLVETIFTSIAGCRQMCRAQTPLAVFAAYARTKNVLVGCDRTATQPPHVVL